MFPNPRSCLQFNTSSPSTGTEVCGGKLSPPQLFSSPNLNIRLVFFWQPTKLNTHCKFAESKARLISSLERGCNSSPQISASPHRASTSSSKCLRSASLRTTDRVVFVCTVCWASFETWNALQISKVRRAPADESGSHQRCRSSVFCWGGPTSDGDTGAIPRV